MKNESRDRNKADFMYLINCDGKGILFYFEV